MLWFSKSQDFPACITLVVLKMVAIFVKMWLLTLIKVSSGSARLGYAFIRSDRVEGVAAL